MGVNQEKQTKKATVRNEGKIHQQHWKQLKKQIKTKGNSHERSVAPQERSNNSSKSSIE